jgi:heme a synthase
MTIASYAGLAAATRHTADTTVWLRRWLWCVTLLVIVMVVIGGATRLTGSGLSITEWRPVTGAIPPLNEAAWLAEFARYRETSQYALINKGMSLGDFQFIYWWEWGHRQLGRAIGLIYVLGLVGLAITRQISLRTGLVLFGIGLLLALQGAIGWIMVASGLKPGMVAVAPVKLTLHLSFACLFFASLIAMLQRAGAFGTGDSYEAQRIAVWQRWGLLALVFAQIALGGLVAGSRAGLTLNTWPLMDGQLIPSREMLWAVTPVWENLVDNPALVQFNHRLGAYILLIASFGHLVHIWRSGQAGTTRRAGILAGLVLAQAILGIITLLLVVPLWAGLAHQALALFVLMAAIVHVASAYPLSLQKHAVSD